MANIIIPHRRKYGVLGQLKRINWDNPITKDLLFFGGSVSGYMRNLVNIKSVPWRTTGGISTISERGITANFNAEMIGFNASWPTANVESATLFAWVKTRNGISGWYSYPISIVNGSYHILNLRVSGFDLGVLFSSNNYTTGGNATSGTITWNSWNSMCGIHVNSSLRRCFLNKKPGSDDTAVAGTIFKPSVYNIGGYSDGSSTNYVHDGNIQYPAIWSRALLNSEVDMMHDSPQDLLEVDNGRLYFDVPPTYAPTKDIGGLIHLNKTIGGL